MIRLAVADGPELQSCCVAVETNPVSADPVPSAVPLLWPLLPFHSTEYATVEAPAARVNAFPAPLPVAVIEYPFVTVFDQTQTSCALRASDAGSWLSMLTSERPEMRTLLGTEALMVTEPVEVEPALPCDAAYEGDGATTVAIASAPSAMRLRPSLFPIVGISLIPLVPGDAVAEES